MAKGRGRSSANRGLQETLLLDGRPSISPKYDESRAAEAARRRSRRRGALALNARTAGFVQATGGLWVPASGTESSAVVVSPEVVQARTRHAIRDNTVRKYADNPEVSPAQARSWGTYNANLYQVRARGKYRNWIIDSLQNFTGLCQVLDPKSLEFDGEAVRASEPALGGVKNYLIALRSFVGDNVEQGRRRQYMQPRWTNKVEEAQAWASGVIDHTSNGELSDIYDEALYSYWSREQYWQDTFMRIEEHRRAVDAEEPEWDIPFSAYEQNPEALVGESL